LPVRRALPLPAGGPAADFSPAFARCLWQNSEGFGRIFKKNRQILCVKGEIWRFFWFFVKILQKMY